MRVLSICEKFPPDRGGLAASSERIASSMADTGVETHVLLISNSLEKGDLESSKYKNFVVHRLGRFDKFDRTYMVAGRAIELLHRRHPFDAIVGIYLVHAGYLAAMHGKLLGIPSVALARGNDVDREFWRPDRLPFLIQTLKWADAVGCVGTELVEKCKRLGDREKVFFTPNSVDAELFKPVDADPGLRLSLGLGKGPVIGFSGELRFKKGLHHLIEAARVLLETNAGYRFLLVGGVRQDDRREFDKILAADKKLADAIVSIPYITDAAEMPKYYGLMDVMFMPSLWDGMPNAALEAMACGTLVVASSAGGLADLINSTVDGYLFPPGDLDAELDALRVALGLPGDARRAMTARAREKVVQNFNSKKEIETLLDVIRSLQNKLMKKNIR